MRPHADSVVIPETQRTHHKDFRDVTTVLGIWLLVFFVGVHTMAAMRALLVPLFWAFFLMMGLLPAADFLEGLILKCFPRPREAGSEDSGDDFHEEEETGEEGEFDLRKLTTSELSKNCGASVARTIAVLLVAVGFLGTVTLFFTMIYASAVHMQTSWHHYEEGGQRMAEILKHYVTFVSKHVPDDVIDKMMAKAFNGAEEVLSSMVSDVVENVSAMMVQMLMLLLYMVFWLCAPMHVGKTLTTLFRRYILLKTLASAGYACCVFLLLYVLGIDLAIVFGLITFLFNFVPEVGPFIATMLPVPVVLFDGRLENPLLTLCIVLSGTLTLKFFFANIVEVKLIESQREMMMHPVVILFAMAFFGWIWGATGMVLSVPAVAVAKASMHLLPPLYRDPLLVFIEGNKRAPQRYMEWRKASMEGDPGDLF